jgi:hypothetical protein
MICRTRGSIGAMEYERAVFQLAVYCAVLLMLYVVDRWSRG